MTYFKVTIIFLNFLNKFLKVFVKAEPFLELSQASMMELFRKNSERLSAILAKSFIIDVQLVSKYASEKID